MTREESVKVLTEMQFAERTDFAEDPLFAFGYSKEYHALEYAIDALNSFPHWIPCSERLPEINHIMYDVEPFSDNVLVAIKNEYGADDTRIAYLEQKHGWILNMDDGFRWMVIAWMPLPEPYKGDTP